MTILGLLPFFIMTVTSYVKIIVITSLVRNALGVQQIPPGMVLNGLAIILTIFIMAPVILDTFDIINESGVGTKSEMGEFIMVADKAGEPLKNFLIRNTDNYILRALADTAKKIWPLKYHPYADTNSFIILIPSFVASELTIAFKVGFLIYLPFIVIDLIVSNILLAMGMMMVSPMTISLPFKLLLFVTMEGWLKVFQGILLSYR
jgi:type III secretion protein R